jgi:hypothetical protein
VWHVLTAHVLGVTECGATSPTKPIHVNPNARPLRLQHVSANKTGTIGRHAPPTGPAANERSGPPGYVLPGVNYYRLTDSTVVVQHMCRAATGQLHMARRTATGVDPGTRRRSKRYA